MLRVAALLAAKEGRPCLSTVTSPLVRTSMLPSDLGVAAHVLHRLPIWLSQSTRLWGFQQIHQPLDLRSTCRSFVQRHNSQTLPLSDPAHSFDPQFHVKTCIHTRPTHQCYVPCTCPSGLLSSAGGQPQPPLWSSPVNITCASITYGHSQSLPSDFPLRATYTSSMPCPPLLFSPTALKCMHAHVSGQRPHAQPHPAPQYRHSPPQLCRTARNPSHPASPAFSPPISHPSGHIHPYTHTPPLAVKPLILFTALLCAGSSCACSIDSSCSVYSSV